MPLREFKCEDCGYIFEILLNNDETISPTCPECGSDKIKKLFSMFGFKI